MIQEGGGNRSWRIGQLNVTHATDWTFFLLGGRESHAFPSPLNPLMYPLILLPWCTGVSGEGFAKLASMMLRGTSLSGGCESLVDVYITGGCKGRIRQKTSCRGITKQVIDAIYPWVSNKIVKSNNISIIIWIYLGILCICVIHKCISMYRCVIKKMFRMKLSSLNLLQTQKWLSVWLVESNQIWIVTTIFQLVRHQLEFHEKLNNRYVTKYEKIWK